MKRGVGPGTGTRVPSANKSLWCSAQLLVFSVLSGAHAVSRAARSVAIFLATLILLNVVAAVLETVPGLQRGWGRAFAFFEAFSVAVFTIEYALRLWACTADERYSHWFLGRLRYAVTPLMLLDLLAIAPSYATSILRIDLRTLRSIRLIRLLRVFKIARYSESLQLLGRVLVLRRNELLITLVAVAILLVVSSTLMYYAECDAQPKQFSSIPAAMWWSVETLTTIGYGDIVPVTVPGRIINSFIALLGIGLFALPAGILGSGFVEAIRERRPSVRCRRCGAPIEPLSDDTGLD